MCLPAFYEAASARAPKAIMVFLLLLVPLAIGLNVFELVWGTSHYVWTDANLPPASVSYYAVLDGDQQSQTNLYGFWYFMIALNPLRGVVFVAPLMLALVGSRSEKSYWVGVGVIVVLLMVLLMQVLFYSFWGLLDPAANWIARTRNITVPCLSTSCPYALEFLIIYWSTVGYAAICAAALIALPILDTEMKKVQVAEGQLGIKPVAGEMDGGESRKRRRRPLE